MLAQQLEQVKRQLIEFATLVEGMVSKSIKGVLDKDEGVLKEVIERDERRANEYDNSLEEHCTTLLAQFEPVARDLRTLLMILKMNNDLERMGDHAVNISESGLFLIVRPKLKISEKIPRMAEKTLAMLKPSIDAFINGDVELAKEIREKDNEVDDLAENILKEAAKFMKDEQDGIRRSLHLIRISHNLERIADLSTNIAEDVIFMVEGKDIRHHRSGADNK